MIIIKPNTFSLVKQELNFLLEDKDISGIPILILSNKIDIENHAKESEIIKSINADYINDNPWALVAISALKGTNIDQAVNWLLKLKPKATK